MIFEVSFLLGIIGGIHSGVLICRLNFVCCFITFIVSSIVGFGFLCGIALSLRMITLYDQALILIKPWHFNQTYLHVNH